MCVVTSVPGGVRSCCVCHSSSDISGMWHSLSPHLLDQNPGMVSKHQQDQPEPFECGLLWRERGGEVEEMEGKSAKLFMPKGEEIMTL